MRIIGLFEGTSSQSLSLYIRTSPQSRFIRLSLRLSLALVCLLMITALGGCGGMGNQSASTQPAPVSSPTLPTPTPVPQPAPHLQVWTKTFNGLPVTMVGTDPSIPGSGTTSIKTLIIPVRRNFGGTTITPEATACYDLNPS